MKKFLLLLLTFACYQMSQSQIPYKSPFFADDIVIQDTPDRDQRVVCFTSSLSGWDYVFYQYITAADSSGESWRKSTDDGESWTSVFDPGVGTHKYTIKSDLLTIGDTPENSFLISLFLNKYFSPDYTKLGLVMIDFPTFWPQYTSQYTTTGMHVRDAAFDNDLLFPATGSNPGSLAMVFSSKYSTSPIDSISVWTSNNQGILFTTKKIAYSVANKYLDKVDISYGHAPSLPGGKYFITWDERDFMTSKGGHVYYSHNTAGFNSSYSTAVDLNQFLSGTDNLLRNPKIAVQTSPTNNGKGDITAVILAEKYDMITQKSQVIGFVNDHASTDDNNWRAFVIGDISHNTTQPDIAFNMYDSTFMVVYFDSTEKKIPYLLHKFDFDENPIQWNILSPGINNSDSISNPQPQVKLCYNKHAGAVVWSSDNELGNGVARYDAPFHYYTGVKESSGKTSVKVYPNPATDYCTIDLLNNNENVEISLTSSNGIEVKSFRTDQTKIQIPLTDIQEGFYLIKITSSQGISFGKVVVNR